MRMTIIAILASLSVPMTAAVVWVRMMKKAETTTTTAKTTMPIVATDIIPNDHFHEHMYPDVANLIISYLPLNVQKTITKERYVAIFDRVMRIKRRNRSIVTIAAIHMMTTKGSSTRQ